MSLLIFHSAFSILLITQQGQTIYGFLLFIYLKPTNKTSNSATGKLKSNIFVWPIFQFSLYWAHVEKKLDSLVQILVSC